MRRWNGWGDDTINFELNADALAFLAQQIGSGTPVADAAFEQACAQIRPTRLAPHRLISTDAASRLHNALGQSLPDWLRLRYGVIDTAPDGVAYPESAAAVRQLARSGGRPRWCTAVTGRQPDAPARHVQSRYAIAAGHLRRRRLRPRSGGAAARARLHAGPLPAVVR